MCLKPCLGAGKAGEWPSIVGLKVRYRLKSGGQSKQRRVDPAMRHQNRASARAERIGDPEQQAPIADFDVGLDDAAQPPAFAAGEDDRNNLWWAIGQSCSARRSIRGRPASWVAGAFRRADARQSCRSGARLPHGPAP